MSDKGWENTKEIIKLKNIKIMLDTIMGIAGLIVGLVILAYFWFIIPARMARKRGRSEVGWVLLGFCISPFWVYILLAILGDTKEKIK